MVDGQGSPDFHERKMDILLKQSHAEGQKRSATPTIPLGYSLERLN